MRDTYIGCRLRCEREYLRQSLVTKVISTNVLRQLVSSKPTWPVGHERAVRSSALKVLDGVGFDRDGLGRVGGSLGGRFLCLSAGHVRLFSVLRH